MNVRCTWASHNPGITNFPVPLIITSSGKLLEELVVSLIEAILSPSRIIVILSRSGFRPSIRVVLVITIRGSEAANDEQMTAVTKKKYFKAIVYLLREYI